MKEDLKEYTEHLEVILIKAVQMLKDNDKDLSIVDACEYISKRMNAERLYDEVKKSLSKD